MNREEQTIMMLNIFKGDRGLPLSVIDNYNLAIKAIEKQMPKKILKMRGNPLILDCPTCKTSLYNYENDEHCYKCGQAIDWEVEE